MTDSLQNPSAETAAKLQRMKEKLGLATPVAPVLVNADGEAVDGSAEVPGPAPAAPSEPEEQKIITGEDVDWSNFDLDPNLAHMYPTAKFIQTLEGPKWVALLDVFEFESAEFRVSKAAQKQGRRSLGEIVTERVNGSERWRIATVFNSSPGYGAVMFTRTVQIVLPDPRELRQEAEMPEAPTDPELAKVEDEALGWIESEGQATEPEAEIVSLPEVKLEGVGHIELNPVTERVPLGAGFNATDASGSILPTTVQVPAVQALDAGQQAAEALMGPDFETEEGTAILDAAQPLKQIDLSLEGEQQ